MLYKVEHSPYYLNSQERRIDIQPAEDEEDPDDGLRQKDRKKIESQKEDRKLERRQKVRKKIERQKENKKLQQNRKQIARIDKE